MLHFLPILLQLAAPAAAQPLSTLDEVQFTECLDLARKDPASAISSASLWAQQKGGYLARACHGFALATDFKFDLAVPILSEAATPAPRGSGPKRAMRPSRRGRRMSPSPRSAKRWRLKPLIATNAPIAKSTAHVHSWPWAKAPMVRPP